MAREARPRVHRLVIRRFGLAGGRHQLLSGLVRRALPAVIFAALIVAACGAPAPEVPLGPDGQADTELGLGRTVYGQTCSTCHGNSGQGGRGKRLNGGRAEELYPNIDEMIAVITDGKGSGMPSFSEKLTAAERRAVARYVREVLD